MLQVREYQIQLMDWTHALKILVFAGSRQADAASSDLRSGRSQRLEVSA